MKKVLAILLAVFMIFSITACGPAKGPEAEAPSETPAEGENLHRRVTS